MIKKRVEGWDFIRSTAILIVFCGHILQVQARDGYAWFIIDGLNLFPGITMSLLGFISAVLLSDKQYDYDTFLVKRFTRIFIPLACCLFIILAAHAWLGKIVLTKVIIKHVLFHFLGLSDFFHLFGIKNEATIGYGLWFITAIMIMYLIFPLLQKLFRHHRGFIHLVIIIILCTIFNYVIPARSTWNVFVSFSLGVYLSINSKISQLIENKTIYPFLGMFGLMAITILSNYKIIPYNIRHLLYAFYPLAFVPIFFMITKRLPKPILVANTFFASLSYEFFILHFYFISNKYPDYNNTQIPLCLQMTISFLATLFMAFLISKCASMLRKVTNEYLLSAKDNE